MRNGSAKRFRYDRTTIALHWMTALLVAGQWLGAQTIDWFPRGGPRVDARSVHISVGLLLGIVLLIRIAWRAGRGRRLPPADEGPLHVIAKATHWGLYASIAAMVSVGVLLTWVRGDSIFGWFSIPAYAPDDRELAHRVQDVHATIGWLIIALAGVHAMAALVHHYVWHDGVLARMLPGLSKASNPAETVAIRRNGR